MINQIAMIPAGMILCRAVYTDITDQKIENSLIIAGLLGGVLFSAIRDGPAGVWCSVKMVGIVFTALILLFVIKGLGAGDIKLFCVLAAFFPSDIIQIIMVSFFAGGILALGKMLWRFVRKRVLYIRHETMNFTVPISIGTGLVMIQKFIR